MPPVHQWVELHLSLGALGPLIAGLVLLSCLCSSQSLEMTLGANQPRVRQSSSGWLHFRRWGQRQCRWACRSSAAVCLACEWGQTQLWERYAALKPRYVCGSLSRSTLVHVSADETEESSVRLPADLSLSFSFAAESVTVQSWLVSSWPLLAPSAHGHSWHPAAESQSPSAR